MSCVGRGHRHERRQIDGRWYWACRDCPDRLIAAPPTPDTPTGPRLDGDQVVGDQVMIQPRHGTPHGGRLATIIAFHNAGFGAKVKFLDGTTDIVLTSRCNVTDAAGLCWVHHISRCTICAPGLVSR